MAPASDPDRPGDDAPGDDPPGDDPPGDDAPGDDPPGNARDPEAVPFDVVVVGGGPAGISASLILGRCRRSVLLLDDGEPRNAAAQHMHGFVTRDGVPPLEFLRMAREELEPYGVAVRQERAVKARCLGENGDLAPMFEVTLSGGGSVVARRLLLATGVTDELPEVEGVRAYYGKGVHHCPYCDGWEHADGVLGLLGSDESAVAMALGLLTWSPRVVLFLDGGELPGDAWERLEANGVRAVEGPVAGVLGDGERADRVALEDGREVEVDAVFFHTVTRQRSDLPEMLGCAMQDNGEVRVRGPQKTDVPGLFMAGDADGDVQFVIVAAAEGARAAVAINHDLQREERV